MSKDPKPRTELELETDAKVGPWLVLSYALEETIESGYILDVELAQHEEKGGNPQRFLGSSCALTIMRGDDLERRQCGIVRRVTRVGVTDHHQVVRLEIVPALWTLEQRVGSRIFQDEDVTEIIREVLEEALGDYGRAIRPEYQRASYPKREYTVQHRESDFDFVRRLMEEEGIFFFFDHRGKNEVLVLTDDIAKSEKVPLLKDDEIPINADASEVADRESFRTLRVDAVMRPTSVTVRDYDWSQPPLTKDKSKSLPSEAPTPVRELYETGGVSTLSDYQDPKFASHDTHEQARLRLEAEASQQTRAVGASDVISLHPGVYFKVIGHHDIADGKAFMVTRILHHGYGDHGIALGGGAGPGESDYGNELTAVDYDKPFRLPRRRPQPRIFGPQTATVVGAAGEEVYTDEHGRIKVHFHWDREHSPGDSDTTCWLRVSQTWAGPGYGTIFIPRVGMEVMVTFIDGLPDRPLVTGCVYNGQNPPPYPPAEEKTKSVIKTNSSIGGGGFNELHFEDAKGEEKVYLHAQKDLGTDVKNDQSLEVGNDRTLSVTGDDVTQIDGDKTVEVGGNWTCTTDGNVEHKTTGKRSYETDLDCTWNIDATWDVDVCADSVNDVGASWTDVCDAARTTAVTGAVTLNNLATAAYSVAAAVTVTVVGATTIMVGGPLMATIAGAFKEFVSSVQHEFTCGVFVSSAGAAKFKTSAGLHSTIIAGAEISVAGAHENTNATCKFSATTGASWKTVTPGAKVDVGTDVTCTSGPSTLKIAAAAIAFDTPGPITVKADNINLKAGGMIKHTGSIANYKNKLELKNTKAG